MGDRFGGGVGWQSMNITGFPAHNYCCGPHIHLLFFAGKYCYQRYLVLEPLLKQVRAIEELGMYRYHLWEAAGFSGQHRGCEGPG